MISLDTHSFTRRNPVVFFDGECALCNASVRFILRHEKHQRLYFMSLQSELAADIIRPYADLKSLPDSILLFHRNMIMTKSEAVLEIASLMGGWVRIFLFFRIFPTSVLNVFYDIIARNRKKLFGKSEYCALTTGVDQSRFLDS